jgi:tetratricopeptide (TPR) repeat protein
VRDQIVSIVSNRYLLVVVSLASLAAIGRLLYTTWHDFVQLLAGNISFADLWNRVWQKIVQFLFGTTPSTVLVILVMLAIAAAIYAGFDQWRERRALNKDAKERERVAEARAHAAQQAARHAEIQGDLYRRLRRFNIDEHYLPDASLRACPDDTHLLSPVQSEHITAALREKVQWLRERLHPKSFRALVALFGPSGSDKSLITRMLLDDLHNHAADDLRPDFYDGVLIVECAHITEPEGILVEIGLRFVPGRIVLQKHTMAALVTTISAALRGARALIVLDHVDFATLQREKLNLVLNTLRATGVAVLVLTEQTPDPISFPAGSTLDVPKLTPAQAMDLAAREVQNRMPVYQQQLQQLSAIVYQNPLTVRLFMRLAACWQARNPQSYRSDMMQQVLDELAATRPPAAPLNAPPRLTAADVRAMKAQQGILIDHAYHMLSPSAQALYRVFGVLARPYCSRTLLRLLDQTEQNPVAPDLNAVSPAMQELQAMGLVVIDSATCWLPIPVYQNAQARLSDAERRRASDGVKRVLISNAPLIFDTVDPRPTDAATYMALLNAAFAHKKRRGRNEPSATPESNERHFRPTDPDLGLELCRHALQTWRYRGWYVPLMTYLDLSLQVLDRRRQEWIWFWRRIKLFRNKDTMRLYFQAYLFFAVGLIENITPATVLDDVPLIEALLERATKLTRFLPDRAKCIHLVNNQRGVVGRLKGDFTASDKLFQDAFDFFVQSHDADNACVAQTGLMLNALAHDDIPNASKHALSAVQIYSSPSNTVTDNLPIALANLGYTYYLLRDFPAAITAMQQATQCNRDALHAVKAPAQKQREQQGPDNFHKLNEADLNQGLLNTWDQWVQLLVLMGRLSDVVDWSSRLLNAPNQPLAYRAFAHLAHAQALLLQGRFEEAQQEDLVHARRDYRCAYDRVNEATVLLTSAHTMALLGRPDRAQRFAIAALERFIEAHHAPSVAAALTQLGDLALQAGQIDDAEDIYLEARAILQEAVESVYLQIGGSGLDIEQIDNAIQARDNELPILLGMGRVALQRCDLDNAASLFQEAHDIADRILQQEYLAQAEVGLADVARLRYDLHKARSFIAAAEQDWERAGDAIGRVLIPFRRGQLALAAGNLALAEQEFTIAHNQSKSNNPIYLPEGIGGYQTELIAVYLQRGDFGNAQKALAAQHSIIEEHGQLRLRSMHALHDGLVQQWTGNSDKAAEQFDKAFVFAREMHDHLCESRLYVLQGNVLRLLGDYDSAERSLQEGIERCSRYGDFIDQGWAQVWLGEVYAHWKPATHTQAWQYVAEGRTTIAKAQQNPPGNERYADGYALGVQARFIMQGLNPTLAPADRAREAERAITEACAMLQAVDARADLAVAMAQQGTILAALNRRPDLETHFQQALDLVQDPARVHRQFVCLEYGRFLAADQATRGAGETMLREARAFCKANRLHGLANDLDAALSS